MLPNNAKAHPTFNLRAFDCSRTQSTLHFLRQRTQRPTYSPSHHPPAIATMNPSTLNTIVQMILFRPEQPQLSITTVQGRFRIHHNRPIDNPTTQPTCVPDNLKPPALSFLLSPSSFHNECQMSLIISQIILLCALVGSASCNQSVSSAD